MTTDVHDKVARRATLPLYYATQTLCPVCNTLVTGKVVARERKVFIERECPAHGSFTGLVCSDQEWYEHLPQFYVEGIKPLNPANKSTRGCPNDCGLCKAHSQIAGTLAIDVSNKCNSNCPCCIIHNPDTFELTVQDVEKCLRAAFKNQSYIDSATLTGGEPTIHPHFFEILDVLDRPDIGRIAINTNGIRIANDEEFVRRLATRSNINVALHYDGVHSKELRGNDHAIQVKAANRLKEYGIIMVPVVLAAKGFNDAEVGPLVEELFANYSNVKSLTVTLMAYTGENGSRFAFDPLARLTIPEALESMERTTQGRIRKADFIPIPMPNPMCTAIGYFLYMDNELTPLFQFGELHRIIDYIKNGHFAKMTPEFSVFIRDSINALYASPEKYPHADLVLAKFRKFYQLLFPQGKELSDKEREQLAEKYIRVIFMYQMMDTWSFDSKRLSRCSCHHAFPDGRIVPACSYHCYQYMLDEHTVH